MRQDVASYGAVAVLTVIWGSAFALTELALVGVPAAGVAFGRAMLATIVIVPAAWALGPGLPRRARDWGWSALVGLLSLALPFSLIAWAQQSLDSGVTGVLIGTIPLFILGLARLILKEAVRPRQWLGFTVGLAGIAALGGGVSLGAGTALPALAVIAASLCYAGSSITVKSMPPLHPLAATGAALIVGTLLLAPAGLAPLAASIATAPGTAIVALGVLGLVQTGAAQLIRYGAVRRSGPVFMSLVSYLIPIWAGLLGVTVMGETLTLPTLAGFALIMAGLLIARTRPASR